ncbi:MAG: alpha/beta fold hydrolase [Betaproteobacteria bacterium]
MYLKVDNKKVYAYTANRPFDAAKPTVVFIHGAAHDHSVWTLQSRYFAYHGWNALAVDLPGHGKSQGRALERIGDIADWMARALDAAGADTASLVGHSMGSLVALETAARHPARVAKLALVGTAVPMAVSAPLLNASKTNEHLAYEMTTAFSHSNAAQLGGNRVPGMWMMGSAMRLLERAGSGVLHADFSACDAYRNGLQAAAQIKCPALLILGRRDQMASMKVAAALATGIQNVRTVVLEGAGHALMTERPDAVLDALIEHLSPPPHPGPLPLPKGGGEGV